jgi:peptidyl-prolyl cis-trans isomerase D
MLKQLGRLERTRGIIIVGFILILTVSLVAFFTPGRSARYVEPTRNTEVIAKVGSEEVTVADLAQLRENYQQMLGGQMSLAQLGGNKRFLDGLIHDRVVAQEAARLGLAASDAEVAEKIRKQFTDASGQFVGIDRYKESVIARFGDVEKYERNIRYAIAQEKLKAFVTAGISMSDNEVQEEYQRDNTKFEINYVVISPEKLAEKIAPSDEELRNYYEQHKTDYRILEPQKKIRYLYIDQDKSGQKLQISDKDLHDEYEKLDPGHKQAGVRVQQILLKVARKDLDSQVEQKAKDLIAKLNGAGTTVSEEAFAESARGNSEDPATAKNGGTLPRIIKKNPNKADPLYDQAVDMQPGEISETPIKHNGSYYILRRGESVPKTFEDAKQELLVSLRNRRGFAVAVKLADRAQQRLQETKDPQKVAQELAAEANMKPAEMIRETPYVKPGDDVPDIGSNQQFETAIEPLNNPNDVGARTGVKGGFAIPMLVEKKDPRVPEFEEVKSKVADAVKQERAKTQLDAKAKELAASVNNANEVKAAGDKAGFETGKEESYKLGGTLGKAGTSPALDEAIYTMKPGEVTRTPIKVADHWVVLGLVSRTEADLAEFAKQRDQLKQSRLSERQSQVFEDYIAAAQRRMKDAKQIIIYTSVLDQMEEDEPAAAPPPQFPLPTK